MPAQHRFYLPPRSRFLDTLLFDKKLSRGRLVGSVFTPLGEPSIYVAWRTQIYTAWRNQYLRRLAQTKPFPRGEELG